MNFPAAQHLDLWLIPLAVALDFILGDPYWLPHPIRWMGRAIEWLEPRFRLLSLPLSISGGLMALVLISGTWAINWLLLTLAYKLHTLAGLILAVLMLFFTLSIRSLASAANLVYQALALDDIPAARRHLAGIVGRQVDRLDAEGIARAAVETVAENLVDGVISPLFYTLIGGPALAMTYKMINTLDSMIGYKNDRYREFGRWAARIDDAANYLPARLCVPVIAVAAQILKRRGRQARRTAGKEGRLHLSPNAGFPEAAFAGALGVTLGGPNRYHGRLVNKPFIGQGLGPCRCHHIKQAWDLMLLAAFVWAMICWIIRTIVVAL